MIHPFQKSGLSLVLDTGSGAVHVLDDTAHALLNALDERSIRTADISAVPQAIVKQYGVKATGETLGELQALCENGLLYADDSYAEFQNSIGEEPIKAMCLHIAHDCNLRCRYCFASTGDFGGGRRLMSEETARAAIDLLIASSGTRRNLEVDFFGGEPLMNFDVVRKTVAYARGIEKQHGKNFRFTVTTNGMLLNDDNIDFINREMSNVVLSLDGRREVNDRMRPTPGGQGSFDTIVPKFQKLVQGRADKEYYVRGTYTAHNLDFAEDVLALYELGFDQISVEPVIGPESDDYAIQPKHLAAISQSYDKLMAAMMTQSGKKPFNFFHFMVDLNNGPCAIKRLKGCGSGNEYIAVTPDGEIYPCHQFVGKPEFIMGNVEQGIQKPEMKTEFAGANLFQKKACQTCWAKFFCSGGCNANNYTFEGSILEPHKLSCELELLRLECAIALQAYSMLKAQ